MILIETIELKRKQVILSFTLYYKETYVRQTQTHSIPLSLWVDRLLANVKRCASNKLICMKTILHCCWP